MITATWSITNATAPASWAHGSISQPNQDPSVRPCRSSHQRIAIENGRPTAQRVTRVIIATIRPAPIGPRPVSRAIRGAFLISTSSATIVATRESTRSMRTKRSYRSVSASSELLK